MDKIKHLFFKYINCIILIIEIVMATNHNLIKDRKANLYKENKVGWNRD
jgi:hypothetical protein